MTVDPTRRKFIKTGLAAGAFATLGATFSILEAYADSHEPAGTSLYRTPKNGETTLSVLLESGFRKVTVPEYERIAIEEDRVVAMVYSNNAPENGNFALSIVFKVVLNTNEADFRNIFFLAIDGNMAKYYHLRRIEITTSPSVAYHLDGKRLGISRGGPANLEQSKSALDQLTVNLYYMSQFQIPPN